MRTWLEALSSIISIAASHRFNQALLNGRRICKLVDGLAEQRKQERIALLRMTVVCSSLLACIPPSIRSAVLYLALQEIGRALPARAATAPGGRWSVTNVHGWRVHQPSNGRALNDYAARLFTLLSFFIEFLTLRTLYGG